MSLYLLNIGESLAHVLEHAAEVQTEQFAGYAANFEFWVEEFEHLHRVQRGYTDRVKTMQTAYCQHVTQHSGPNNLDDVSEPYQKVTRTTTGQDRKEVIDRNRKALVSLLDRALKLELIDFFRHDALLERIGVR